MDLFEANLRSSAPHFRHSGVVTVGRGAMEGIEGTTRPEEDMTLAASIFVLNGKTISYDAEEKQSLYGPLPLFLWLWIFDVFNRLTGPWQS